MEQRLVDAGPDVDSIVLSAVGSLRRRAFHESSFSTLAADCGVPVEELQRHFPTWSELLVAVIGRWTVERMRPLSSPSDAGAAGYLRRIVVANLRDPALVRLLVTMAAATSHTPEDPLAVYLVARTAAFHDRVTQALIDDVASGLEPAVAEPAHAAEQLLLLFDGLQIQWMTRADMDVLGTFDRSLAELRFSWRYSHLHAA